MANEIAILDSDGNGYLAALFLYPIAVPRTYPDGTGAQVPVIYTSSALLSPRAASVLTVAEKAGLDAGTLAFELVTYKYDGTLTDAQNATAIKAMYATYQTRAAARYTDTFRYTGVRITYP